MIFMGELGTTILGGLLGLLILLGYLGFIAIIVIVIVKAGMWALGWG